MTTMMHFVRHGQASFGASDYDNLSDIGHAQARALGRSFVVRGAQFDACFIGAQRRHRQTFDGIAEALKTDKEPIVLEGLNEFDFAGLLEARFAGQPSPADMHTDRKVHFRLLREVVLDWQRDEIDTPPERFSDFYARVTEAVTTIESYGAKSAIAVSSGGPIGLMSALSAGAPPKQMVQMQLQTRNCGVTKILLTKGRRWLHGFNETPFLTAENTEQFLTYS